MSIKRRIMTYIDEKGISKSRFEKQAGLSNGYLNSISDNIGLKKLEDILKAFPDLSRDWLLTGEGEMLAGPVASEAKIIEKPNFMLVPLITKFAYAGYTAGFGDDNYIDTLPAVPFILPEDQLPRGDYRAIEVRGDSMDNGTDESIKDGDVLLCRMIRPDLWVNNTLHMKKWNFVIVHQEGILVKRIVHHDVRKGSITIHSLNPLYTDQTIQLREVSQIMNVVQMMRKPVL